MTDVPKMIDLADFRKGEHPPEPGETLSFLKAYMQIKDPRQKDAVVSMIEKILAEQAQ